MTPPGNSREELAKLEPVAQRIDSIGNRGCKYKEYGLCAKCSHFLGQIQMSGAEEHKQGRCVQNYSFPRKLDPKLPIIDCSSFYPIGQMSLFEMIQLARPLETRDLLKDGYR